MTCYTYAIQVIKNYQDEYQWKIGNDLNPYGENIEGYYSMIGADFETVIDSGLVLPTE